jgi:hypothetical protein
VNSFFDTSGNGVNVNNAGTGTLVRCKFTNCWFGSHTGSGVVITAAGGGVDGITLSNCDFYGSVNGFSGAVATGGSINISDSRFAGNTTAAINIAAGSSATSYRFGENRISPQAGFGVNGTGILIASMTLNELLVSGNYIVGNTTNTNIGTITVANWANFRIVDNPGINPKGAVTTPTFPASAAVVTNTTGFRVSVYAKSGTTAPTVMTINGVSTVLPLASQLVTIPLDPGGTVAFTYTVAPTWTWVGN